MKWTVRECRKGDMIRVRLGSLYHYGVFLSEDEVAAFGYPPLPQFQGKQQEIAVLITDIDTFSCSNMVEAPVYSLKEKMKKRSPQKAEEEVRRRLGETGYDIIHNNCEHFAYEIVFGEHYSEQEEQVRKKWAQFSKKPT